MRRWIHPPAELEETHAHSHWREALQMQGVWPELHPGHQAEGPHAPPRRLKVLHVRQMWQDFPLQLPAAETPEIDS